jgi:FdhD protein
MQSREVAIERIAEDRTTARDHVVVEAPLQIRARGTPVATIMRTPGHDLELARGLLHAEGVAGEPVQVDEDAVDVDVEPGAFAGRGLLASAACGVCGRVAIADLELKATEVTADTTIAHAVLVTLPDRLRAEQQVFGETGGLHGAGLFTAAGEPLVVREDVGRHNAVDKVIGYALAMQLQPAVLVLSGRAGYELLQKAIMAGVPIVASVSAPSSLAIELAERFGVALAGFVRGGRCNVYSHGWRIH